MFIHRKLLRFAGMNTSEMLAKTAFQAALERQNPLACIDLGCGAGTSLIQFQAHHPKNSLTLIDKYVTPSPDVLDCPGVDYRQECILDSLRSTKNDLAGFIFLKDIVEHFPLEEAQSILRNVYRVLAPGGIIFIQVPNGTSPFGLRNQSNDVTHFHSWGHVALASLVASAGFVEISPKPVYEIPSGRTGVYAAVFQRAIVQPLLQKLLSSSIGWSGEYFWTPNFSIIASKPR